MKVGTICKLKVACLGNKAGALGVVFTEYDGGFQAIFENGSYDGFSINPQETIIDEKTEADYFLEEVGFEVSLADYEFSTVMRVGMDYRKGLFNIAWSSFWQKAAEQIEQAEAKQDTTEEKHTPQALKGLAEAWRQSDEADEKPEAEPEYEKCEVYVEEREPLHWLMFKRGNLLLMLSSAMDIADFSHFEYEFGESSRPRFPQSDKALYPKYVVFRKKGD